MFRQDSKIVRFQVALAISVTASHLYLPMAYGQTLPSRLVINELDYDQPGTDGAEFIELKNVSMSDINLAGVEVVLVNGASGGAVNYQVIALPAVVVPAGGYYVVCGNAAMVPNCNLDLTPDTNLVQNGAPDAVALFEDGEIIDAVSYEGSTLAPYTEGSGVGLADDGVAADTGLSRFPDGADTNQNNVDFSVRCLSPGASNRSASNDCAEPDHPVIVFNEIMKDPFAVDDDDGEWFELHNPMSVPININGWRISDNGVDGHTINNGVLLTLPPGGYVVLGNNGDMMTNGGVALDYIYTGVFLANGADELILEDDDGNEVDRVEYDDGMSFPDPSGASLALRDPALDNNVGANWCTSTTPFGSGDRGTPGATNDCNVVVTGLVINEIDYDQPAADTMEFIEIKNVSQTEVNLGFVDVQLINGSGGGAAVYASIPLPNVLLPPGGYFVICASSATVLHCDLDVTPDTNLIQNGAPDAVALVHGPVILDTVSYEGDTGAPYTEGSGSGLQDDPDFSGFGLSRCPDGGDTQMNNVDYIVARVTPGESNDCDRTPPEIQCPGDFSVDCAGPNGTIVQFAASAMDETDPSPSVVCDPPSGSLFPIGTTTVTCTATDASGNLDACEFEVTVIADDMAPQITLKTSPIIIAPALHQYVHFRLSDCIDRIVDDCAGKLVVNAVGTVVSIYSDEPEDAPGDGDGNTTQDIVLVTPSRFKLRAEAQQDNGNGRVYGVNFEVRDPAGNTAEGTCYFHVLADEYEAVDDGAAAGYTVP